MDFGKWAFNNRLLVYFLVAVFLVGGAYSCYDMSKLEDPQVKVKLAMVVTTYPGASAHQVEMELRMCSRSAYAPWATWTISRVIPITTSP